MEEVSLGIFKKKKLDAIKELREANESLNGSVEASLEFLICSNFFASRIKTFNR